MTLIFDTCTAHYLLNENDHHGLKYLTRKYLKKDVVEYEDAIKYGISSPEFYDYATEDAVNTYLLFQKFSPEIEKQGLHHLAYDIEFPFSRVLMELNINGLLADREKAHEVKEEVKHLYYETENKLLQLFNKEYETKIKPRTREVYVEPQINFNSDQQVAQCMIDLGIELTEKTKGGQWATGNTVLETLKADIERKLNE